MKKFHIKSEYEKREIKNDPPLQVLLEKDKWSGGWREGV